MRMTHTATMAAKSPEASVALPRPKPDGGVGARSENCAATGAVCHAGDSLGVVSNVAKAIA